MHKSLCLASIHPTSEIDIESFTSNHSAGTEKWNMHFSAAAAVRVPAKCLQISAGMQISAWHRQTLSRPMRGLSDVLTSYLCSWRTRIDCVRPKGGLSALHMLSRHYSGDKIPANESKCLSWWGDWPSETDRLYLCEIGNERRDSIGQLEEKLRVLQVKPHGR